MIRQGEKIKSVSFSADDQLVVWMQDGRRAWIPLSLLGLLNTSLVERSRWQLSECQTKVLWPRLDLCWEAGVLFYGSLQTIKGR